MNSKGTIKILNLYPEQMNIYGDWGNVLTLVRRLQWHGYTPKILQYKPGKNFPTDVDLIIGGGGQDSSQLLVETDLQGISKDLHKLADNNVPMLVVCGLYQLFGKFFKTNDDKIIKGIGMFNFETYAGSKRLVGNVIVETPFGEVIGYENHSGKTMLDASQEALGTVKKGGGNNGTDKTEGAIYRNVYGTYLHGSILPKNPVFADALLEKAIVNRYGEFEPNVIDDTFAASARTASKSRPR